MVNDLDPKDRDIAMVFQNYALYPQKSVYKNLAFPLQMRKLPQATRSTGRSGKRREVLDMTHLLERKPRELSGGQQQRVALGRALVRDPAVFLMDEPLSNLDAKLRVQMRSEIKRFHQDLKATIIYVTHDQLEAVTMADKMAVMNGGFLQQYDSPAQVFAHPVNMFVASFVGSPAMSLIPLEASTLDGRTVLPGAEGWSLPLSPRNARKVAAVRRPEGRARRAPLDDQAAPECDAGRVPAKAYTVEPTGDITFVQAFLSRRDRQHQRAAQLSPSRPTSRSGSSSTRSACTCSTAKLKWPSRPTETRPIRVNWARMTAKLKITAIKPYPVWVGIRNQLLVKVETDEGIYGWGESGLSGREKAVAGAIEHYREFLIGRDPMQIGAHLAGDLPQPVFRGRPRAAGRDLRDRHRPPRHQGQGAGRAGLPAARRQAARPRPDLRLDRSERRGPMMIERASELTRTGLDRRSASSPPGTSSRDIFEPRESIGATASMLHQGARGARRRRRPRHRLPSSPVGRRGRVLLPASCRRARSISSRSRSATRRPRPTNRCAR